MNAISFSNGSFPAFQDFDQLNDENTFKSASQCVDIDLMEYQEISNQSNNGDVSLLNLYFRKKSSSLERLNFTASKRNNSVANSILLEDDQVILCEKSSSDENISTASSSPSPLPQTPGTFHRKSVHFVIARYSPFNFDFLTIRNLNHREVALYWQFVIDEQLKMSSFTVYKGKLTLQPSGSTRAENLATLFPLESGNYLIQLYCFPLCRASSRRRRRQITSPPIVVNVHLKVVNIVVRPFLNSNGPQLIELDCFHDQSTRRDVLFRMDAQQHHFDRPFTLQLSLCRHSPLITFASDAVSSVSFRPVNCHFVNSWTCFITFEQPGDFIVHMQMKHQSTEVETDRSSLLSIRAIDSVNSDKFYSLAEYQMRLNVYPKAKLARSVIQCSAGSTEITGGQWKRIDLRNKDHSQLVHVNFTLTLAGDEVVRPNWKCTQTQLTLRPLTREAIYLCVSKAATVEAASTGSAFNLYVHQSAGEGRQLTSVLTLRPISAH